VNRLGGNPLETGPLEAIRRRAATDPDASALLWRDAQLGYGALVRQLDAAVAWLRAQAARVIALDLENGPDWVVVDLAALQLGLCCVPLPLFFSPTQRRHALAAAGVELVVSDCPDRLHDELGGWLGPTVALPFAVRPAAALRLGSAMPGAAVTLPGDVRKITFTSGTTGSPKGVPLRKPQIDAVVASLVNATGMTAHDTHLALTPFAVLLENVGGLYVSLSVGARVALRPIAEVGMQGGAGVDGERLAAACGEARASTAIFTPQTLQALVERLEQGHAERPQLRFAAVGGAPVSPRLLERAHAVGLPVHEGYGLSECASVVALNTASAHRAGSVGRVLPHVRVEVAADGEILVLDAGFAGYLGQAAPAGDVLRTGDLGHLDSDGFLYLTGRRRDVFITAFGRNVSPGWVERELMLEGSIAQAAVFGEARPFNVAVLRPTDGAQPIDVDAAIARVNRGLPDYARVTRWVATAEGFSPANGLLTATGRVRRAEVARRFESALDSLYREARSS
jgi:long-subunit acyl-CoA synthetase (AMP-forming)